jgi:hypothetical protein
MRFGIKVTSLLTLNQSGVVKSVLSRTWQGKGAKDAKDASFFVISPSRPNFPEPTA